MAIKIFDLEREPQKSIILFVVVGHQRTSHSATVGTK